ncbi:unnamed protein product [Nesidiocoris tenuis]|uniref:Uncharacterized protein n=1 Tax=Nesidiocoris tenuis TaxID=355587 RepID=A0A6H5H7A0_9HEMI|nr:unnamed protein product [Nesidiocoris tenuis]
MKVIKNRLNGKFNGIERSAALKKWIDPTPCLIGIRIGNHSNGSTRLVFRHIAASAGPSFRNVRHSANQRSDRNGWSRPPTAQTAGRRPLKICHPDLLFWAVRVGPERNVGKVDCVLLDIQLGLQSCFGFMRGYIAISTEHNMEVLSPPGIQPFVTEPIDTGSCRKNKQRLSGLKYDRSLADEILNPIFQLMYPSTYTHRKFCHRNGQTTSRNPRLPARRGTISVWPEWNGGKSSEEWIRHVQIEHRRFQNGPHGDRIGGASIHSPNLHCQIQAKISLNQRENPIPRTFLVFVLFQGLAEIYYA